MKTGIIYILLVFSLVTGTFAWAYTFEDNVDARPSIIRMMKYLMRVENRVRALEVQAGIKTQQEAPQLTKEQFKTRFKAK